MKKSYYIPIVIFGILLITNPSLKDFKEHEGITTTFLESRAIASRTHNFFICSCYAVNGSDAGYYFGVVGNFFWIESAKQKSNERLQAIYDQVSAKMDLGNFESFKAQLKDKIYRIDFYTKAMMLAHIENYVDFEKDVTLATN